ncbi:transcription initiation factor TFIID subunit 1-like [Iris pallida]|uniref:Transcription initiation factor TFIID subunit 1-like n=1 Tax=Iris pallida TaxID=29817 RepID=A0AAX6F8Y8_IRIPA|nr:transcription initiation factor TFIID subunit 1-like [Iris pallida]KAJ6812940.1 transcription initiation factor TFIID subunit 1-like [Iris pallida]
MDMSFLWSTVRRDRYFLEMSGWGLDYALITRKMHSAIKLLLPCEMPTKAWVLCSRLNLLTNLLFLEMLDLVAANHVLKLICTVHLYFPISCLQQTIFWYAQQKGCSLFDALINNMLLDNKSHTWKYLLQDQKVFRHTF